MFGRGHVVSVDGLTPLAGQDAAFRSCLLGSPVWLTGAAYSGPMEPRIRPLRSILGHDPVILEIDLDRGVLSTTPANPLAAYKAINTPTMRAIRDGLRDAATDERVRGLIIHVGTCPLSLTQVDELGDLIEKFGESKPTVAFAAQFGEFVSGFREYRLAARASEIWLAPPGLVSMGGLHLDITLYRGGMEKLGVEPEFGQRKEYKSAAEAYAGREISPANREMMTRIGESIMDATVEVVARRRQLSVEAVWDAVNTSPLTAEDAVARGFVDHIGYRDEVYAAAREAWGVPAQPGHPGLKFVHRFSPSTGVLGAVKRLGERGRPTVGTVTVKGGIVTGRGGASGRDQACSGLICEQLRAAGRDESIQAVVLRVDSPGGSATASDEIWREVTRLAAAKPVVASMGDLAASGGYYVSMGATEIVANPSTLTGSIGVLAGKFVTRGLFDKLGLVREGINIGARAGMLAGESGFTDDQWDVLNAFLDRIYADFTAKAAAGRHMDLDQLEPLARGRVWTGTDAAARGLVDHLGGVDLALERACALAEIDRDAVQLRSLQTTPLLARLRPADSTESVAGVSASGPLPGWVGALAADDPLEAVLARVGIPGVLSLPWRIRVT